MPWLTRTAESDRRGTSWKNRLAVEWSLQFWSVIKENTGPTFSLESHPDILPTKHNYKPMMTETPPSSKKFPRLFMGSLSCIFSQILPGLTWFTRPYSALFYLNNHDLNLRFQTTGNKSNFFFFTNFSRPHSLASVLCEPPKDWQMSSEWSLGWGALMVS